MLHLMNNGYCPYVYKHFTHEQQNIDKHFTYKQQNGNKHFTHKQQHIDK